MSATPTTTSSLSSSYGTHLVQSQDISVSAGAHVGADPTTKDVRAHEHARQRTKTKERREHALARRRKEKAAAGRVLELKGSVSIHGGGQSGSGGAGKLARRLSMENWDGDEPRAIRAEATGTEEEGAPVRSKNLDGAQPQGFTELTLGDLISRPRRPKAKLLDFEVIPPIRNVIVLDDVTIDADEPWEYITRASLNDGSSSWKGKSYAQAVASAM